MHRPFVPAARSACLALVLAAAAGSTLAAPDPDGPDGPAGHYDVALADLAKDGAQVRYGTMRLQPKGRLEVDFWTTTGRDPIPGRAVTNPLAPTILPAERSIDTDRGAKVVVHPAAFSGPERHAQGEWWQVPAGLCVKVGDLPTLLMTQVTVAPQADWGSIYRSAASSQACARPGSAVAPGSVVAAMSQRVYDRQRPDFRVRYQRFDGIMTRLNGWESQCSLSVWQPTAMHFTPGVFQAAGKDLWRAVSVEHPAGGDMQVFTYLAIPQTMTPVGRVVLMDVGHDFNRNGRIDDDWGHIYQGFPIVSRAGDLGGMLMIDNSPVGIREVPYKGGCMLSSGQQITHTLGLILYVSEDIKPKF